MTLDRRGFMVRLFTPAVAAAAGSVLNPVRALAAPTYAMWQILEPQRETVRRRLARSFACDPEEIALTRNASEGLQICQLGFDLRPGDEVLTTNQDYPRMITTFQQRGLATVEIDGIDAGELSQYLWSHHRIIVVAIIHPEFQGIRVSPSVYTTREEIDRFADAMEAILRRGNLAA